MQYVEWIQSCAYLWGVQNIQNNRPLNQHIPRDLGEAQAFSAITLDTKRPWSKSCKCKIYLKLGIIPRAPGLCEDLVKILPDLQGLRSVLPQPLKDGVLHHNQRAEPERAKCRCAEQEAVIKGNLHECTSCAPWRRAGPQSQIAGYASGEKPTVAVCTMSSTPWFLPIFCLDNGMAGWQSQFSQFCCPDLSSIDWHLEQQKRLVYKVVHFVLVLRSDIWPYWIEKHEI